MVECAVLMQAKNLKYQNRIALVNNTHRKHNRYWGGFDLQAAYLG